MTIANTFAGIWAKIVTFWSGSIGNLEAYLEGLLHIEITNQFWILTDVCLVFLVFFIWLLSLAIKKLFPNY